MSQGKSTTSSRGGMLFAALGSFDARDDLMNAGRRSFRTTN